MKAKNKDRFNSAMKAKRMKRGATSFIRMGKGINPFAFLDTGAPLIRATREGITTY